MAFVVVYDACVLYPAPLRDLLLRIGLTRIVRPCWSEQILDECFSAILRERVDLSPASLERTRELMCRAMPDCIISGYESLIPGLVLPDEGDRHVLAAAIRAGAQVIVTFNLKDFPPEQLTPYHIEAKHPDDFVNDSIDISPGAVIRAVSDQAAALKNPPMSVNALLDTLRDVGLVQSVARLRDLTRVSGAQPFVMPSPDIQH